MRLAEVEFEKRWLTDSQKATISYILTLATLMAMFFARTVYPWIVPLLLAGTMLIQLAFWRFVEFEDAVWKRRALKFSFILGSLAIITLIALTT